MRSSSVLIAFATLLPLACSNGGATDGGSGVCGGSESTCATLTDCCTGFQCEAGKCVFVGGNGGNGNGGGSSSTSRQGSSASSGFGSSSGTQASGSSSGTTTFGSTGGTARSSTGGTTHSSTGGTTVHTSSTGGTTHSGTGGSSGASGGSPDLCALCDSAGCAGANDLCVCDPDDANCTNDYCAGSCLNPNTGVGEPSLCPTATTCVAATDSQGSMTDYVCLPSPGTCLGGGSSGGSSSGGSSSGGNSSSGSVSATCGICAVFPSTTTQAACTGQTSLCTCDPDDQSCVDGYCVANCESGSAADQALCPTGTTCLQTLDWATASITEYGCYPAATGTCLDGG